MQVNGNLMLLLAGAAAGAINGLLGAGGGLVLIPLLTLSKKLEEKAVFPASISIMLPVCLVSLLYSALTKGLPWNQAIPYLAGSVGGGLLAGVWGKQIPVLWLHRGLGILMLWGGLRYLC